MISALQVSSLLNKDYQEFLACVVIEKILCPIIVRLIRSSKTILVFERSPIEKGIQEKHPHLFQDSCMSSLED